MSDPEKSNERPVRRQRGNYSMYSMIGATEFVTGELYDLLTLASTVFAGLAYSNYQEYRRQRKQNTDKREKSDLELLSKKSGELDSRN